MTRRRSRTSPFIAWLLLLVVLMPDRAIALPSAPTPPDPHQLRQRRRTARIERGVGLGLVGLGLGSCAAGGALIGLAGRASYDLGSTYSSVGWASLGVGAVLLVPGITFSVLGQNRLTDVDWRLKLLAGSFVVPAPGGVMVGTGLRF